MSYYSYEDPVSKESAMYATGIKPFLIGMQIFIVLKHIKYDKRTAKGILKVHIEVVVSNFPGPDHYPGQCIC